MRRLSLFAATCVTVRGLAIAALAVTALILSPMPGAGPLAGSAAHAQTAAKGPSGLPLPRFVSLKAKRVNLRVGPGRDYAVAWLYTRSGVPMEVVQEKTLAPVRDAEGRGLGHHRCFRTATAVTAPWIAPPASRKFIKHAPTKRGPTPMSSSRLEPASLVEVKACDGNWCETRAEGWTDGWRQDQIWGAYPGEAFK